jgi:nucleotide-binding universal stress UspA family protein
MALPVADHAEHFSRKAVPTGIAGIMVHVDFDRGSDDRIRIASDLADRLGAVLIGVTGWVPGREFRGGAGAEVERTEIRLARISAAQDRLAERFRSVAGATIHPVEWRAAYNFPSEVIAREARTADLVVIGGHPIPDDPYHTFDPGTVLLTAGRPVLVAPEGLTRLAVARVLIAWKDTREARRAVQSALPFLRVAEQVTMFEIADEALEEAALAHLDDLEVYLGRHRIKVSGKAVLRAVGSVSEQLKNTARNEGADLIVAGAYGHTRLGEWIFGGVTHDLSRTTEVCCLFSS